MSEKIWRLLKELGLTQYEIQVYAALLASGPMHHKRISKETDIPFSKVVEILENLLKKGWVESDKEVPIKYYPKSPSTALEAIKKTEVELNLIKDNVPNVETTQQFFMENSAKKDQKFSIVNGEYNILIRIRELLPTCKKELQIVVPNSLNEIIELLLPTLSTLKNRGLGIDLIVSKGVNINVINRLSYLSHLRIRDKIFNGYIIRDSVEVMLLLDKDESVAHRIAIYSSHFGLIRFVIDNFTYLWKDSRPYM